MAWIESHQDIGQHPKTYALATALNVDTYAAVGILHLLWHFALKFSWRNGDLKKYPPEAIAQAIGWREDATKLIAALQKTGWLNKMRVHDWMDYAGKIVHDRMYNQKRRKSPSYAVPHRKSTATVPDLTVPYPTEPKVKVVAQAPSRPPFSKPSVEQIKVYCQTKGFKLDAQHFWDHYEANGWRVGRNPMKNWQAAVGTWMRSEFRTEENNGTHERKSIFGVPDQKSGEGRRYPHHSDLRKVPSAGQILAGVGAMPVPPSHRSEEPVEPHRD